MNFLDPAGSKTGKLLPTGHALDVLEIPGHGPIEATILDVSNPIVLVRAEDIGLTGTELPEEMNANAAVFFSRLSFPPASCSAPSSCPDI